MPAPNNQSFFPFGSKQSRSRDLPPRLKQHALDLYSRAWAEYTEAGCPYGPSDAAMLVWYSLPPDEETASPLTSRN